MIGIDENGKEVYVTFKVGDTFATENPETGEAEYWRVVELNGSDEFPTCEAITKEEFEGSAN